MKPLHRSTQKFHRGDLVRVARDLGSSMSHFTANVDALVLGSYRDECAAHAYGGDPRHDKTYALMLLPPGEQPRYTAWYHEEQLTLLLPRTIKSIERTEALNRHESDPEA